MSASTKPRRPRPPLAQQQLQDMALRYVGKYATTRAKLRSYLARKLRERGWSGDREPDLEALADRFAELGYIDDASFAISQSRSLSNRGYGKRRLSQKLRVAGVEDVDSAEAYALADSAAVEAALRFAARRRLGPYASCEPDPADREKWIGAMIRAGHGFGLARAVATLPAGESVDVEALTNELGGR